MWRLDHSGQRNYQGMTVDVERGARLMVSEGASKGPREAI
jgi:hypothetical protein